MKFQYNDGGRKEAGYRALNVDDCVTRAIAIAANLPYQDVYNELKSRMNHKKYKSSTKTSSSGPDKKQKNDSPRNGVYRDIFHPYILSLGFSWVPCMKIGQGCKVHLDEKELPDGILIVKVSKHLTTVIDGVIHDTFNPCREGGGSGIRTVDGVETRYTIGKRCVYGYYLKHN